jgi:tetratricopeptide (TPR) repeat protein
MNAAKLLPDDPNIQFELGKNAGHLGRRDEALASLRRAVELRPKFVEALSLLGTKLMETGQNDEAFRYCREAVELRPSDPLLLLNLGEVLRRRGNAAEALEAFEKALKLAPDYAEAHNNAGWVSKDVGRYSDALQHFRDAVRLRPGAVMPMLGLAWLLAAHPEPAKRQPAEAVRLGEQLANMSGYGNWMALDTLAVAYAAAGRSADATRTEEKALALVQTASPPDAPAVRQRLELFRQGTVFVEPGSGRAEGK